MEVITQERIDEMKAKLALLEGDRKAYFESAMHALSENKKRVGELRFENNKLRNVLREGLSSGESSVSDNTYLLEDHIIHHVFHNRQADRACLSNKSGSDAVTIMDYRTCDAMKKYNALRHHTVQKEEKIEALKKSYRELQQAIEDGNATTAGTNKEGKRLRELENRLDKAQLKYQEAEHIKRTYTQIKDKLQDEHLTYGHSLDALEKQIKLANDELAELQIMLNDAVLSRDAAQRELKYQEEVVSSERRRRDAELSSMKRTVRDSITEDAQGGSGGVSGENSAERGSAPGGPGISEEQQQKIASFEEAFQSIKEATGLSDLIQIVKRFENQGETLTHLHELKDKAEKQCQALREERDRLQLQFEELKYSGETELTSIMQLLDQYKKEAETEAQRREQLHQNVSDASRLLVQCKAGVDHIHDKLTFLNVSAPYTDKGSEGSEGQLPEMLKQCNERLDELMASLQDVDIEEQLNLMEQEENGELAIGADFFNKLEGRMPDYNTRIKIPSSYRDTVHEEEELGGDDNDILTRAALKKQSQQIVEMRNKKRQPRKKKRRSK
ncbi:Coiled-coil domain-containing protein [Paragonimus skrjabini miyazakii]|uniref:Coiled-coil domain-containing protein n=1 Tax=Paragonimus skrjabini miyazakii TaxID=59628 RepID=A0A8S9Z6L5_9TREM|nr:Coiled-coil domain-containing protein [Paragonimus skrjabini miyazakii]